MSRGIAETNPWLEHEHRKPETTRTHLSDTAALLSGTPDARSHDLQHALASLLAPGLRNCADFAAGTLRSETMAGGLLFRKYPADASRARRQRVKSRCTA